MALAMVITMLPISVLAADNDTQIIDTEAYVAHVNGVGYSTLAEAVAAAKDSDTITVIADISGEAVTVSKSVTITGAATLNNVQITGSGTDVALTVRDLNFTGSSYINANNIAELTVASVTADVEPTTITGRAAFIVLGTSELTHGLKLTVTNNEIKSAQSSTDFYSAAIFGWRYIDDGSVISGNTFGADADAERYTFIAVKTMNAMDGAKIELENNTIYGTSEDYVFLAFDLYQNCSRANAYTVSSSSNVINATVGTNYPVIAFNLSGNTAFADSTNITLLDNGTTVNGAALILADIDANDAGSDYDKFYGVDVVTDSEGKVISGTFGGDMDVLAANIASGYEVVDGVVSVAKVKVNAYVAQDTHVNGWVTVWGQLPIIGSESFYVEVYSGETYLGKTTLVDTDKVLLDGAKHEVTWHAFIDGSDSWWNTEWTVAPVSTYPPTAVKYFVDGVEIGLGEVKMSSADDLNPVVWEELRGVGHVVTALNGSGTAEDPYLIHNTEELIWFRDSVNTYTSDGSNQYKGKYVKLAADIDLDGMNWTPIGTNSVGDHMAFLGIFDGDGHTISNLYINADGDHLGFFARVGSYDEGLAPTVKNLTFNNVDVSSNTTTGHGGSYVGGVIANAGGNTFVENVHVTGDVYVVGYGYVGGMVGHGYPKIDNCSVDASAGSYINCYYWSVGGILGYGGEGGTKITNSSVIGDASDPLYIWGAYGGAAAVCGNARSGAAGEYLTVKNVEVAGADYALGYVFGNDGDNLSDITVENVKLPDGVEVCDAVASIGDAIYFDLRSALDAGGSIVMLRDVTLTEGIVIPADKTVVLDMAGKSVSYASDVPGEDMITNKGNLTITDSSESKIGKLTYNNTDTTASNVTVSTISCEPGSVLTLNAGAVENKTVQSGTIYAYAIDMLTNGSLGNVTATISGGTVYSDYMAIRQFNNGDACKNTLTVTAGYIYGAKRAIQVHFKNDAAYTTISGGKIEGGNYSLCLLTTSKNVSVTDGEFSGSVWYSGETGFISGGTYNEAVNADYCAAGYIPADNGDGTYGVKVDPAFGKAAKIGDIYYATLAEAIANAQSGDTIVLLTDVELTAPVVITGKTVTLDLGEYTITDKCTSILTSKSDSWGLIELENDAELIVTGNGTIDCNYTAVTGGWTGMAYCINVDATSKLTVNSGTFINSNGGIQARGEVTVNDGTFASHNGGTCIMAAYSAKVTVNGGTFKDSVEASDAYTGSGAVWGGFGATIEINGGTYDFAADPENENIVWTLFPAQNAIAGYGENANMTVNGGTFSNFDPSKDVVIDWSASAGFTFGGVVADDCAALPDLNGNYVVGEKPTATVNNMGAATVAAGDYMVYGNGDNTAEMPLSFVMQFLADQTAEDMEASPYADWYGDFVITFTGLENGSFVADGCYLAGHYGSFGWVKVPVDGLTVEEGMRYPVMLGVGMGQKYDYICSEVEDFKCALYLTDAVLQANPNIKVTLELAVVDNSKGQDAATEALVNNEGVYRVTDYAYEAEDFVVNYAAQIGTQKFTTLEAAVAAAQNGETVTLLDDVELNESMVIPADKTLILDLAGKTISYSDTVQGNAMITNKGNLTINDTVGTGVINYNYTGAADPSYGKGNYTFSNAGTLTVNGGKITIANLSGHVKYPIDNNSTTGDAVLVINGGHLYNYNTSAIRQFCNSTTNKNSVTINGGLIEGYSAIWVQNPGAKTVNGKLTITGGEIRTTAKAYVEGTAELEDVSSSMYCTIDGEGGAWSEDSAVTITGGTFNENVYLATGAPTALTVDQEAAVFNGRLELPQNYVAEVGGVKYETAAAALKAAKSNGDTVVMMANSDESDDIIMISSGVTLDLAGYQLKADSVVGFAGSQVCDSSTEKTGRLVTDRNAVVLNSGNTQVPVWTGDSYVLASIKDQKSCTDNTATDGTYLITFRPSFGSLNTTYLAQGGEACGLQIGIRVIWTKADGIIGGQTFTLTDDFTKKIYGEGCAVQLSLIGLSGFNDVAYEVTILSDATKVAWTGKRDEVK